MHAANGVQPGASCRVVAWAAADHMLTGHDEVGDVRGVSDASANVRGAT